MEKPDDYDITKDLGDQDVDETKIGKFNSIRKKKQLTQSPEFHIVQNKIELIFLTWNFRQEQISWSLLALERTWGGWRNDFTSVYA